MASKLLSALAATALLFAAPNVARAQDDDGDTDTAEVLGVTFTLIAILLLMLGGGGNGQERPEPPVSPRGIRPRPGGIRSHASVSAMAQTAGGAGRALIGARPCVPARSR
jgi:hypothetical protein